MAARFPDKQIATTLNRLRLQTGTGNTWNDKRVRSARYNNHLPIFDLSDYKNSNVITLQEAAQRLNVSPTSVRRMIAQSVCTVGDSSGNTGAGGGANGDYQYH